MLKNKGVLSSICQYILLQIMAARKRLTREEKLQRKRGERNYGIKKLKMIQKNINCKSKKKKKNI